MFDKMKQAAKDAGAAAGRAAAAATDKAGEAAAAGIEKASVVARDPATHARAKIAAKGAANAAGRGAGAAGRGVKSALDKLNPGTLAAIVIKATSIQEQANRSLRKSKSLYRIGGIEIGAAFPPSISFQIVRAAELELEEEAEEDAAAGEQPADEALLDDELAEDDEAEDEHAASENDEAE
jgi:hypothetical protein